MNAYKLCIIVVVVIINVIVAYFWPFILLHVLYTSQSESGNLHRLSHQVSTFTLTAVYCVGGHLYSVLHAKGMLQFTGNLPMLRHHTQFDHHRSSYISLH